MKLRLPLFSFQAAGTLAGGLSFRRSNVGQLVGSKSSPPDPATPKQLRLRARHAALTAAWQAILANQTDRPAWDRLRRYRRRPGTAYSEYLHDHLSALWSAPVWTVYETVINRVALPGRIIVASYTSPAVPLLEFDYGPTPCYPYRTGRLFLWAFPLYLGNFLDEWPTKHVFGRARAVQPFGPYNLGFTGLFSAPPNG